MFTSSDIYSLTVKALKSRAIRAGLDAPIEIIEERFVEFVESAIGGFETSKEAWDAFVAKDEVEPLIVPDSSPAKPVKPVNMVIVGDAMLAAQHNDAQNQLCLF